MPKTIQMRVITASQDTKEIPAEMYQLLREQFHLVKTDRQSERKDLFPALETPVGAMLTGAVLQRTFLSVETNKLVEVLFYSYRRMEGEVAWVLHAMEDVS